jgi:selenide,water dikinase
MADPIRLTQTVKGGGCAAKIGPGDLSRILAGMTPVQDSNVLLGLDIGDDAGVYKLSDDLALVQTTDFFTPVVDDPYRFGQIAAANALSDVYAMGGEPLTALNLVCFPLDELGGDVLRATLEGGLNKCNEAGCAVVGGHSIRDTEFKFGLAVTGRVHPDRFWKKTGGQPGDAIILTKPLGTGVIAQALKKGVVTAEQALPVHESMAALNGTASALLEEMDVHSCTDVTGFGLGGHAAQMVLGQPVGFALDAASLPLFDDVLAYVEEGLVPGGCHRNKDHFGPQLLAADGVSEHLVTLMFDPQTSGGLLFTLPAADAEGVLEQLGDEGVNATQIGEVTDAHPGKLRLG